MKSSAGGDAADTVSWSGSLAEMLAAGTAALISDRVVRLALPRRSSTLFVRLDVSFLGARIMTSGLVFPWRDPDQGSHNQPQRLMDGPSAANPGVQSIGFVARPYNAADPTILPNSSAAVGENNSAVQHHPTGGDLGDLDSSDWMSLDMTARGAPGGAAVVGAAVRMKASRPSNLSKAVCRI